MNCSVGDKLTLDGEEYVVKDVNYKANGLHISRVVGHPWVVSETFIPFSTFEEYRRSGRVRFNTQLTNCFHKWEIYKGMTEWFHYCNSCSEKKLIPWTERGERQK